MAKDQYLGTHGSPWPHPIRGPWEIWFHWGVVGNRVECVGLDVRSFRSKKEGPPPQPRPLPDGGFAPVTHTLLRSLKVDSLIQENLEAFEGLVEWTKTQTSTSTKARRLMARALESKEPRRRGRPPKYSADHYVTVAEVYSEAHLANRTPRRAVARHFGVPETTAGHWITKARELGFLGDKPGRGRAGGTVPQPRKGRKS